jgi:hypothetical protein
MIHKEAAMKLRFAEKGVQCVERVSSLFLICFSLILFISCNWVNSPRDSNLSSPETKTIQSVKSQPPENWAYYGKLRKRFKIKDELISKLIGQPPRSAWIESEKTFYQNIVADKKYDVLVVPFQTQAYGLDHIERMLMSYKLAVTIEQNSDLTVAPLFLIYPALGILQRYYDDDDVYALAKKKGISRIIWCYAGTKNEPNAQTVQLSYSIIDEKFPFRPKKNKSDCRKWTDIALQPDYLPFQEFESNLNVVMKFLNIPFVEQNRITITDPSLDFKVPSSPSEMLSDATNSPLLSSYYLQYLAMIAPTDYQKTYLFTRSITNLFQLKSDGPDRKLIEARALLHLYRRPAALKAMEGVKTPEIVALREYANANLPEFQHNINQLKPSIKRLLSELELFSLQDEYKNKMTNKEIDAYVKEYPGWVYFLRKRLAHYDSWELSSNIELKRLLDEYFPVPDYSLKDISTSIAVMAENFDDMRFELLFQDHIHKVIVNRREKLSAATNMSGNALDFDFLIMTESFGIHNLIRRISLPGFTQGLPERGLKICNDILKSYKDHPYFTSQKFSLLYNQIRGSSEIVKNNLKQEVCNLATETMWWNGRQNWVNRTARSFLAYISNRGHDHFKPQHAFILNKDLKKCIGMDYPFRVNNVKYDPYRLKESILPWIHTNIQPLIDQYYQSRPISSLPATNPKANKSNSYILSEILNRFKGHPKKSKFLIHLKTLNDRNVDKKQLLSVQIKKGSNDWKIYKELANLYIEEYLYDHAKAILLKYPGLTPPFQDDIVASSNVAATAGDLFLRRGAIEQAKYFYKISDELDTFSARCIEAQEKLALLEKDYIAASEYALVRAQRYNDPSKFASHMTYLHLQGNHKLAWSLFNSVITRFPNNRGVWTSALIGQRMEGRNEKEIASWLDDMSNIVKTDKQKSYLARFGALSFMDRNPDEGIVARIEKFDVSVLFNYYEVGTRLTVMGKNDLLPYTAFAKGYSSLLKGNYKEACNLFSKIRLRRPDGYFAYAAVKSGTVDNIKQRYLLKSPLRKYPTHRDFDKLLALAVIKGYSGNHREAVSKLKKAYVVRPPTMDDPFYNMYYLMEICDWLYQDSGEAVYLELLLKWCRVYQITAPMFAWPYAIEAKYSTIQSEKLRSLAIAQYLDPHSLRIAEFDQETKDKAKRWLEVNNPFSVDPPRADGI